MTDKFTPGEQVEVIHKYVARSQNELNAEKLEILQVISCHDEWIYTRNRIGKQAMIPASYLRKKPLVPPPTATTTATTTSTPTTTTTTTAATTSNKDNNDNEAYRIDVVTLRKLAKEAESEGHFMAIVTKDIVGKSPLHLTLSEGSFIKVVEQFPTGWWRGFPQNGSPGIVPKGSVVPFKSDDPIPEQFVKNKQAAAAAATVAATTQPKTSEKVAVTAAIAATTSNSNATVKKDEQQQQVSNQSQSQPHKMQSKKILFSAVAMYPYSAGSASELSFQKDDKVGVINDNVDGGWWLATFNGKIAYAPSKYFKKIEEQPNDSNNNNNNVPNDNADNKVVRENTPANDAVKQDVKAVDNANVSAEVKAAAVTPATGNANNNNSNNNNNNGDAGKKDPSGELPDCPFRATVLYEFAGTNAGEVQVAVGEEVEVTKYAHLGWISVRKSTGKLGYIPRTWVKPLETKPQQPTPVIASVATTPIAPVATSAVPKPSSSPAASITVTTAPPKTLTPVITSQTQTQAQVNVQCKIPTKIQPSAAIMASKAAATSTSTNNNNVNVSTSISPSGNANDANVGTNIDESDDGMEINVDISRNPEDYVKASYNFKSGGDTQMSINKDDIIQVVSKPEGSGWWQGFRKNGDVGFFPKSYVRPLNPQECADLIRSFEEEDRAELECGGSGSAAIPPPPLPTSDAGAGAATTVMNPSKKRVARLTRRNSIPPPSEPPTIGAPPPSNALTPTTIKVSLQQQMATTTKDDIPPPPTASSTVSVTATVPKVVAKKDDIPPPPPATTTTTTNASINANTSINTNTSVNVSTSGATTTTNTLVQRFGVVKPLTRNNSTSATTLQPPITDFSTVPTTTTSAFKQPSQSPPPSSAFEQSQQPLVQPALASASTPDKKGDAEIPPPSQPSESGVSTTVTVETSPARGDEIGDENGDDSAQKKTLPPIMAAAFASETKKSDDIPVTKAIVKSAFKPKEKQKDTHIAVAKGDVVIVLTMVKDEWEVELNGARGLVPKSHLRIVSGQGAAAVTSASTSSASSQPPLPPPVHAGDDVDVQVTSSVTSGAAPQTPGKKGFFSNFKKKHEKSPSPPPALVAQAPVTSSITSEVTQVSVSVETEKRGEEGDSEISELKKRIEDREKEFEEREREKMGRVEELEKRAKEQQERIEELMRRFEEDEWLRNAGESIERTERKIRELEEATAREEEARKSSEETIKRLQEMLKEARNEKEVEVKVEVGVRGDGAVDENTNI